MKKVLLTIVSCMVLSFIFAQKDITSVKPTNTPMKIGLEDINIACYISLRDTCSYQTISKKIGDIYGQLMAFTFKNGVKQTNPPFTIYHKFDKGIFDMEAAIPIDKCIKAEGNIKCKDGKPFKAAVAYYYGSYNKIGGVYKELDEWIKKNNKHIIGAPWEIYVTDPTSEKDTAKWLTKVLFPVQ